MNFIAIRAIPDVLVCQWIRFVTVASYSPREILSQINAMYRTIEVTDCEIIGPAFSHRSGLYARKTARAGFCPDEAITDTMRVFMEYDFAVIGGVEIIAKRGRRSACEDAHSNFRSG